MKNIIDLDRGRQWIPRQLQLQQKSIGHSIVQSARRTGIAPTLFGLGIEMDHVFGVKVAHR